ncbi:hypothetical protein AKO1_004099 [Acrasis kona]|uniref:Uncharacterized protein n=1 Tax=Acrasis kona TaxID=1008807 RepID=A0AAW2Z962_9EUKA
MAVSVRLGHVAQFCIILAVFVLGMVLVFLLILVYVKITTLGLIANSLVAMDMLSTIRDLVVQMLHARNLVGVIVNRDT